MIMLCKKKAWPWPLFGENLMNINENVKHTVFNSYLYCTHKRTKFMYHKTKAESTVQSTKP